LYILIMPFRSVYISPILKHIILHMHRVKESS